MNMLKKTKTTNELVTKSKNKKIVIPAKAGIQSFCRFLDADFRRHDEIKIKIQFVCIRVHSWLKKHGILASWRFNLTILLCLCLCLFLFISPAKAGISIDVSSDVINVTTGFDGASLTVFGSQDQKGDLVIVVEGPPKTMTIKQKTNQFGFWTYTEKKAFPNTPSYYSMAATAPLETITDTPLLRAHRIGLTYDMTTSQADPFSAALVRKQQEHGVYGRDIQKITYIDPLLYKAQFRLPAIVASGHYTVSAYLFSYGALISSAQKSFEVVPDGFSAFLRHFASESGVLYGLAGVFMALVAGWLATVLLKRE